MIDIAICNNRKDKTYKNYEIPFTKLIEKLSKTKYTNETYNDYLNLPKEQQDNIKDVGGFVGGYLIDGKRSKKTVKHRRLLTLDVDYGYSGMMEFIEMSTEFNTLMYSTHKHNNQNERFRIVIPLSRKVDAIEYEAIGRKVAFEFGIDYFDDSTYDPCRLMYFPSTSKDGQFKFIHIDENYLDVEKYLNKYTDYKDKTLWPMSYRKNKITNIDKEKQQNPLQKQGIIGAFCKTYNIHEVIEKYLKHVYEPTIDKNRYTYKEGTSHGGLIVYEDCLFAYSHHSTDPCCNKLCNAFDLVKNHKFKNLNEEKAFENMVELVSQDKDVIKILGQESLKIAQSEFGYIDAQENVESELAFINGENDNSTIKENIENEKNLWVTKLEVNKKGLYTSTIDNIVLIL
ncbi:MAG TPA: hypothetical protein VLM92_02890, partial [Romboutsia sp.]|nr:hypothetical protein [Romboutsia sp.]